MRTPALPLAILALCIVSPSFAAGSNAPTTRICLRNPDIFAQRVGADTGYFAKTRQGWWHNMNMSCPGFGPNRLAVTQPQ